MSPSCFQQNLLILSKISKIKNQDGGHRRPSWIFCFVTMATAANYVMIVTMQIN